MTRSAAVLVVAVLAAALLPMTPAAAAPSLRAVAVQDGLSYPWDVTFTPNGSMLVTERPGRIRVYRSGANDAPLVSTTRIPNVRAEGESGIMGIDALRHNGVTYVFVCASRDVDGSWRNQVLRYRFTGSRLEFDRYVIRGGIRANTIHNGCAVEVGPDRKVWIGTGDAANTSLAQNRDSLNGKVLRVNFNGTPAAGNPWGTRVYTMGHRNVQGIAFEPGTGRAFSVEHGPDRNDEINRLRAGGNYGWPCYTGRQTPYEHLSVCKSADSYRRPAWASGYPTLATSGAVFVSGQRWLNWRKDLFVSTLKESDLRRFTVNDTGSRAELRSTLYNGRYGRLRGAVFNRDNRALFLTTSNGSNDRVVRIRPQ